MQSRLTPPTSHRKIVEDSSPISVWSHTNYVVTYTLKNFYLAFITVCTALTHREIFFGCFWGVHQPASHRALQLPLQISGRAS